MSFVVWLELTPPQQFGIMEALSIQYGELYQCKEITISAVVGKFITNQFPKDRELLFYIDCQKRFGGNYEKDDLPVSFHWCASDEKRRLWQLLHLYP